MRRIIDVFTLGGTDDVLQEKGKLYWAVFKFIDYFFLGAIKKAPNTKIGA